MIGLWILLYIHGSKWNETILMSGLNGTFMLHKAPHYRQFWHCLKNPRGSVHSSETCSSSSSYVDILKLQSMNHFLSCSLLTGFMKIWGFWEHINLYCPVALYTDLLLNESQYFLFHFVLQCVLKKGKKTQNRAVFLQRVKQANMNWLLQRPQSSRRQQSIIHSAGSEITLWPWSGTGWCLKEEQASVETSALSEN